MIVRDVLQENKNEKEMNDLFKDVPVYHFDECFSSEDCLAISLEETEKCWNSIWQEMALDEYFEFVENGVLSEAENEKSSMGNKFVAAMKRFIQKVWSVISGMISHFIDWIAEKVNLNKKFVEKNKAKILEAAKNIPSDGLDIGGKWYKFEELKKESTYDFVSKIGLKDIARDQNAVFKLVFNSRLLSIDGDGYIKDTLVEESYDKLYSMYLPEMQDVNEANFTLRYKDFLTGEEHKGNIKSNDFDINTVLEDLAESNIMRLKIRKAYKTLKGFLFGMKLGSHIDTKLKDACKQNGVELKNLIKVFKADIMIQQKKLTVTLSTMKMYSKQNKAICVALLNGGNKEESAKKESAYEELDNSISLLESDQPLNEGIVTNIAGNILDAYMMAWNDYVRTIKETIRWLLRESISDKVFVMKNEKLIRKNFSKMSSDGINIGGSWYKFLPVSPIKIPKQNVKGKNSDKVISDLYDSVLKGSTQKTFTKQYLNSITELHKGKIEKGSIDIDRVINICKDKNMLANEVKALYKKNEAEYKKKIDELKALEKSNADKEDLKNEILAAKESIKIFKMASSVQVKALKMELSQSKTICKVLVKLKDYDQSEIVKMAGEGKYYYRRAKRESVFINTDDIASFLDE